MKKKNILIIGLGNIGKKRFKIILKNKSYDKIYLFDKIKIRSRIKKVIVLNSLKYSDIEKLDLDLAILSLNPEHSFNYASKLIKSGVNVLVEKPPFFNFDQFKKIYELSLKKKKYLFVGFNFLHDPVIQLIRNKYLKSVGKLYKINISYLYGTSMSNINKVGAFMDVGLHLISIINYLFGDFKIIHANFQNFEKKYKNYDDDGSIILKKRDINITINFSLVNWINKFHFRAIGKKGMIELNGLSKWKNQKLNIFQRVFPSGYPKEIKNLTFKKDESFKREILYILKKIDNKKFDRKENKKYFDIINKSFLVYEKQNKKINYFK